MSKHAKAAKTVGNSYGAMVRYIKKLLCADHGTGINLGSLPPDCLRLVLAKVDYGSHKRRVWTLSGTCRSMREAVTDCPATVKLQGRWSRRQLIGATHCVSCLVLPCSSISAPTLIDLNQARGHPFAVLQRCVSSPRCAHNIQLIQLLQDMLLGGVCS